MHQDTAEEDARPAKRAKVTTSTEPTTSAHQYPMLANYRIGSYMAPGRTLTLAEQRSIYQVWKASGSPHNHVCYTCRKPSEKMLECNTCCRSYHSSCLALLEQAGGSAFNCPPCKKRGWHHAPPGPQPLTEDSQESSSMKLLPEADSIEARYPFPAIEASKERKYQDAIQGQSSQLTKEVNKDPDKELAPKNI